MSDSPTPDAPTLEVFTFCREELLPQFTNPSAPVSAKKLCALLDVVLSSAIHLSLQTHRELAHRIKALEQENAALQTRVAELASRPSLKYVGTWRGGTHYQRGDVITKGGGAWTCTDPHVARDQFDHQRFTLFVKAGRDRDAGTNGSTREA